MTRSPQRYAIFRKLPDGSPIWVGNEDEFEKAKQRMQQLATEDGMEYFIHDFRSATVVARIPRTPDQGTDPIRENP